MEPKSECKSFARSILLLILQQQFSRLKKCNKKQRKNFKSLTNVSMIQQFIKILGIKLDKNVKSTY